MLDKNNFVPLYVQLYRQLREEILNGEYKQGEFIPSETELMKTFATTRGTVRNAISLLVNDGLVQQVRGKGTFVLLRPLKYNITNFGGFTDYLNIRNEVGVSKVLDQSIVSLEGKSFYKLIRARGVKKGGTTTYLMIDTSILPVDLFPGLDQYDFEKESLYQVLREKYLIYPKRTEIALSPISIDKQTREILQVHENEHALLKAEGSIFDQNNIEIEKVKIIYAPNIEFNIMTELN
ncbi:GntR family transcriptional regulator [Peribacillus butanolivorans]|uniref:GntR family transcriptional regulator n=1 Tax=Peribacillus butanolivorans TaxID=421767 RepID=A0ABN5MX74_9BACI|nr:GntR family transcriptional regulator [Peribacillus butanolivorans]AXN37713.1 GntR family transcriptional regulator [Peribacillus butanolivorans]